MREDAETSASNHHNTHDFKAFCLASVLFLAIFLTLYSPTIFTGHLLCTEIQAINSFFGPSEFWTNSVYSGFPWIAEPDAMMFYPPAILARLNPANWNAFILIVFVLCGSLMFSLARLITGSSFAGLIAGIAFSMSYLPTQIPHFSMLHAIIWTLAGLLAIEYYARKQSGITFACGALAVTLCGLAGHPQTFASALGLWIFYIVARAMSSGKERRLYFLATSCCMIITGALVASLQLFHTAELASFSARDKFTFDEFLTYSAHPLQAIGVFMPFLFGAAPDGIISQPVFSNFLVYCSDFYYGFIILFLSLSAVVALRKEKMVLFWGVIGVLSFLVSFGNATPLAWLMYHVPPYGSFRALHRMMLLSTIANAILAAICIAAIEKKQMPFKPMAIVIASLTGLFLVLVCELNQFSDLLITQAQKHGIAHLGSLPWTNPSIGMPCVMFALSLGVCLTYCRNQNNMTRALLLLVLLSDLGFSSWYSFGAEWRIKAPPESILSEPASGKKYRPLADAHYNRILTIRGGSASYDELKTNLDQIWNMPQASGYGPLMILRYGQLLNMTEGGFLIPPFKYEARDRCFDILSIRYATAAIGDNRLEDIKGPDGSNWRKIDNIGTASIHENLHVLPRCWIVQDVAVLTPEQIFTSIKTSTLNQSTPFDPLKTALIELTPEQAVDWAKNWTKAVDSSRKPSTRGERKGGYNQAAKITMLTNSLTRVETDVDRPSFLVMSDIFYPGWKATIDGIAAPVYRTDYLLRGVMLPVGKHMIEFTYEPTRFNLGVGTAIAASLLILLGSFMIENRKRKEDFPNE